MSVSRPGRRKASPRKKPFDVPLAVARLREATRPYPKAALFERAAEGHGSLFQILIACIISIRTYDEVTIPAARRLFAQAATPARMAALAHREIDRLIEPCTFHEPKARTIRAIAQETLDEYGGELPCDRETLLSFKGVGPKCANLALGIVCNLPLISVDIHVHRVTNRWGIVAEPTPEKTMVALQNELPQESWVEINALLVPFGKHVCTGSKPKCTTCPLLEMCRQVGVISHR